MILTLQRWIATLDDDGEDNFLSPLTPKGYYSEFKVRLDRVDGFSHEDDELVLIIGGSEMFFDYDEIVHLEILRYFDILDTKYN
jgi:hypothetical protein